MGHASELKSAGAEVSAPGDLPANSFTSYNPLHTRGFGAGTPGEGLSPHMRTLLEEALRVSRHGEGEAPPPGEEDRFLLREIIGKGGFGEVWAALQSRLHREVAVKRLRRDLSDAGALPPGQTQEKIHALRLCSRQEALTTANLEHPNIIPVYDLGEAEDGSPLIALKYIRGKPWDELLLEDAKRLDTEAFLDRHIPILIQMTQAVAFAHSRGVIHRDLKPAQVIVGEFGEVLLADWGLAVVTDHTRLGAAECGAGDLLPTPADATNPAGTPAFMAPEQTEKHGRGLGPWTDVYLLGGTLYYILTLQPPHGGSTAREAFMRARLGEVAGPGERAPGREVPAELAALAMKAMAVEREERVASATEFLESLQKFLSGDSDRRESLRIVELVRQRLATEEESYGKYGDCLMDLGKAQALWKGNRDVPALLDEAHSRFCLIAMEKGDLALARLQAEALLAPPLRGEMLGKVAVREADVRRREAHRFWAISLVWILVFFCITIFAIYQKNLLEERQILDLERTEAVRYQKQTLDLVEAMMDDLQQRLEPAQQLGTLREVAYDVLNFLGAIQTDSPDIRTLILESLAETQMRIALIERGAGDSGAAMAALDGYRGHASEWFGIMGRHPYAMTLFYHSHILSAIVLGEQGRMEEAQGMFLRALEAGAAFELDRHERLFQGSESSRKGEDLEMLAEMTSLLPGARSFAEIPGGREQLLAMIGTLHRVGRDHHFGTGEERGTWHRAMGLSYYALGEGLFRQEQWAMARLAYERGIPIMERSARDGEGHVLPMDQWSWDGDMRISFLARIRLAECQAMIGERELAKSTLLSLVEMLETGAEATASLPHGPKGAAWATIFAKTHRKLARLHLFAGDVGAALGEARQAREVSRTIALAAPDSPESVLGEMLSADVHGLVMAALWEQSRSGEEAMEAAEALARAVRLAGLLIERDPLNMVWRGEALAAFGNAADTAARLGEAGLDAPAARLCEAMRQAPGLAAAHSDPLPCSNGAGEEPSP